MFQTVQEIYEVNDKIRRKFKALLLDIPPEIAVLESEDDTWSVQKIAEHVSIVDEGMMRICSKLLSKAEAEGLTGDGTAQVSSSFAERAAAASETKLKAPEMVEPTGSVSIAEILTRMETNDEQWVGLREKFNSFDASKHTFPHPYFGDLNAQDWLVLRGGHEMRHIKQIGRQIQAMNVKNPG